MARHNIGAKALVNKNTNFITYFGEGKSELIGTAASKIDNYENLKVNNIRSSGDGFIALFTFKYDFLEVSNCEFFNSVRKPIIGVTSVWVRVREEQFPVVSTVNITHNQFYNCTLTFLDR